MNRGEQENLFRQCHTFRLQQDGLNKAHKLHLQNQRRHRGYSQGNIHQLSSNLNSQSILSKSFGEDRRILAGRACDDLVLSVLKTPVRDVSATTMLPLSTLNNATAVVAQPPLIAQQNLHVLPRSTSPHSNSNQTPTKYQTLHGSEDELVDDIESAKETTKLGGFIHGDEEERAHEVRHRKSSGGFKFLRRFRTGRSPKFDEHHQRVSTPVQSRSRVSTPRTVHGKEAIHKLGHMSKSISILSSSSVPNASLKETFQTRLHFDRYPVQL